MKAILIAVLAVLVIILGAFYWYEYRPSQIRKSCEEIWRGDVSYETAYQGCLRYKGLEK